MNKAGQRVASEASSVRNNLTSFDVSSISINFKISFLFELDQ